jgi:hypothetical protein
MPAIAIEIRGLVRLASTPHPAIRAAVVRLVETDQAASSRPYIDNLTA